MSIVKKRLEILIKQLNEKYDKEGIELEVFADDITGREHEHKLGD